MSKKFLIDIDVDGGLTTTGNVGIATNNPETKLDTNGVILARGGSWNGGGSEVNKNAAIVIEEGYQIYTRDNGTDLRNLIGKASDYINIGHANTTYVDGIRFYSGSSANYRWFHGNDENMVLDSTGLGIGTTSPTSKLHVDGGGASATSDKSIVKFYDAGSTNNSITKKLVDATINKTGWSNSLLYNGYFETNVSNRIGSTDVYGVSSIIEYDNNYTASASEVFSGDLFSFYTKISTLNTLGNHHVDNAYGLFIDDVTVGTNSKIDTYTGIRVNGTSVDGTINSRYALVTEADAGNVGIGTTSPTTNLDVRGGAIIAGSTPSAPIGTASTLEVYENGQDATLAIHQDNGASTTKFAQIRLRNGGNDTYIKTPTSGQALIVDTESLADAFVIETGGDVGIGTASPSYKLHVDGGVRAGGKVTYTKSYSSLDTTGQAVAGLSTGYNGESSGFTFTCFGSTGGYQKIVYSCYNGSGTWSTTKVIDEGTNDFDIEASADGSSITFTFKSTSGTKDYTPKVLVEAIGSAIDNSYA